MRCAGRRAAWADADSSEEVGAMRFVKLQSPLVQREMLTAFGGYHAAEDCGEGEFSAMKNLSSDRYPLLSPRRKRGVYAWPDSCGGMIAKDSLCYVDGSAFVINGYPVELGLTEGSKQLVGMGAYVVIFPDKKYINTLDISDYGNLEADFRTEGAVQYMPAGADGTAMTADYIQPEEPGEPENMALWLDTSAQPPALMQWSAGTGMWVSVAETYVKLSAPGIGGAFREGDGVTISGAPEGVAESSVIFCREDDAIVVSGLIPAACSGTGLRVSRPVPVMDFVIECGNRLWGCRFGTNAAGAVVNEIYASKLGDFRNWNCFQGVSTDSYVMSLGADGPFTGAIQHMGYPVFFRERCLHKIYGSYPANFRLQTTPCRGVQRGCGGSLAIVGEVLFYKSTTGICAYDGALPVEVSQKLGQTVYRDAVAGSHGGKYYISMADAGGEYHLFVYDRARNLWHREDGTRVRAFCSCREELYFLDETGKICTVFGSGTPEDTVHWMAETGDIGADSPDNKYLSRLTLRLWMAKNAEVRLAIRYDEELGWHPVAQLRGGALGSVTLPLGVRRCDHLRLRLEGTGDMKLYSITRTIEQGSDVF